MYPITYPEYTDSTFWENKIRSYMSTGNGVVLRLAITNEQNSTKGFILGKTHIIKDPISGRQHLVFEGVDIAEFLKKLERAHPKKSPQNIWLLYKKFLGPCYSVEALQSECTNVKIVEETKTKNTGKKCNKSVLVEDHYTDKKVMFRFQHSKFLGEDETTGKIESNEISIEIIFEIKISKGFLKYHVSYTEEKYTKQENKSYCMFYTPKGTTEEEINRELLEEAYRRTATKNSTWVLSTPCIDELRISPSTIESYVKQHLLHTVNEKTAHSFVMDQCRATSIRYKPDSYFCPEAFNADITIPQKKLGELGFERTPLRKDFSWKRDPILGFIPENVPPLQATGHSEPSGTPRTINHPYSYVGPAWEMSFHFLDSKGYPINILDGNYVYVAPTDIYMEQLKTYRPDIYSSYNPPGDLLLIANKDWCERPNEFIKSKYGIIHMVSIPEKTFGLWLFLSLFPRTANSKKIPGAYNA